MIVLRCVILCCGKCVLPDLGLCCFSETHGSGEPYASTAFVLVLEWVFLCSSVCVSYGGQFWGNVASSGISGIVGFHLTLKVIWGCDVVSGILGMVVLLTMKVILDIVVSGISGIVSF